MKNGAFMQPRRVFSEQCEPINVKKPKANFICKKVCLLTCYGFSMSEIASHVDSIDTSSIKPFTTISNVQWVCNDCLTLKVAPTQPQNNDSSNASNVAVDIINEVSEMRAAISSLQSVTKKMNGKLESIETKTKKNRNQALLRQSSITSFVGPKKTKPNRKADTHTESTINCKNDAIISNQSYIESGQYEMLLELANLDDFKFDDNAVDKFFEAIDSIQRRIKNTQPLNTPENGNSIFIDKQCFLGWEKFAEENK